MSLDNTIRGEESVKESPVEPKGEEGLIKEACIEHLVEGGDDAKDADLREAHSKDSVKFCSHKGQTRLLDCLCKPLSSHVNPSKGKSIGRDEARERARAVLDGELCSVGLVALGLGGRVLAVQDAGDVEGAALCRRDPKIGGASVKNHVELLDRRTQPNLSIIPMKRGCACERCTVEMTRLDCQLTVRS